MSLLKLSVFLFLMNHQFASLISKMVHTKCRNGTYPLSAMKRLVLTDDQVPWTVKLEDYKPTEYNSKDLLNKPWADPKIDDGNFKPLWNELDGNINRKSYNGPYNIVDGRPLNPVGRTGLKGRGRLGRWGPNHAADPVVSRWKMDNEEKVMNKTSNKPILQFCAIQRRDNGQWAIPGGMVDPGEQVNETLRREFMEEALNSLESSEDQRQKDAEMIKKFFSDGEEIYKGYVDDPRNTDNAWMETVAVNFHDDTGSTLGKINLVAGDDAKGVQWMDIDKSVDLYASHSDFVKIVAELHKAHY